IEAGCALQINSIFGMPSANHANRVDVAAAAPCASYHTYTFEWTPDHVTWSIDGREVRRDTGAAAAAYADNATRGMEVHFNIWPGNTSFGGAFSPSVLPVREYISWVSYAAY